MIGSFLSAAVSASTPLLFGTLGAINNEKVGHLNLGIEGIMIMGAFGGFYFALKTDVIAFALLGAMLVGGLVAGIYAVLTITFRTSQSVTGLTLTIFGTGLANTLGKQYVGISLGENVAKLSNKVAIPLLSKIPFIGNILFNQNMMIYSGFILAAVMYVYYYKTKFGMNMKAVGEDPNTADVTGINVNLYKYVNVIIGGAICGLGGAYLSLVIVDGWLSHITSGRGWICVALVVFSSWKPHIALVGAFIFGALDIVGFYFSIPVSQYFIGSLPYVVTIITLIAISTNKNSIQKVPASLGKSYFREDR